MSIEIMKGDVTNPVWPDTKRVIIHNCNDVGAFGAGVAYSILKKWPHVAECYKHWHNYYVPKGNSNITYDVWKKCIYTDKSFRLGDIQVVQAEPSIVVCNLIGQKGCGMMKIGRFDIPPVRYEALYEGFLRIRELVKNSYSKEKANKEVTFHLPLLGSKLAGGDFEIVFRKYMEAFRDTSSRTMFYAFSDEDYEKLSQIYYKNYYEDALA